MKRRTKQKKIKKEANLLGISPPTKIIFFCLVIFILLINFSSAFVEDIGTFKKNECISLLQTCSNCTYSNISLITDGKSLTALLGEKAMTARGITYNFTFCNTSSLGIYRVYGHSNLNGIDTDWGYDFTITITGKQFSTSQGLIYLVFLSAIIILWGFMFYWAYKLPFKNRSNKDGYIVGINDLKWLKIFLIVMCYIFLLWIFGMLNSITSSFLEFDQISPIFRFCYYMMLYSLVPVLTITTLAISIIFIEDSKIRKWLERGKWQ